jgi:hypothetical protein
MTTLPKEMELVNIFGGLLVAFLFLVLLALFLPEAIAFCQLVHSHTKAQLQAMRAFQRGKKDLGR